MTNVANMQNWLSRSSLTVDMKLAMIDTTDKEFPIYDVLNFSYKWDPKSFKQSKGVGGWICTDGYAKINSSN